MTETVRTRVARKAIELTGIVQGVGFRPFVYRLANEGGLTGLIANSSAGVSISAQGDAETAARFPERARTETPSRPRSPVPAQRAAASARAAELRLAPSPT